MSTSRWPSYVRETLGETTSAEAARRIGVSRSTIIRWLEGANTPDPRQVVSLARAYGRSPMSALVAADYLNPGDIPNEAYDITTVSDDVLLDEVKRRFNR